MNSKTAVVILNWNGRELMNRFLQRVVDNTSDADVIVVDNGSTDGSIDFLKEEFPSLQLMEFEANMGFAAGYNKAIAQLEDYDNIILLNSDAAPAKNWIAPLVEALGAPDVVATQPKILSERDKTMFEYAGAAGGFLDKYGYPYCRGRIFDTVEKDRGQYNDTCDIFWASGAAFAVKRKAFIKASGFDEAFFAHMEEIDLCWRLKLSGGRVVYVPSSVVYHLGGGSLNSGSARKTYLNFRNNLLMLHKNLPKSTSKSSLLFKRRLLDTLAFLKFGVTFKFAHAAAILHAHRDYTKMRGNYKIFPDTDLLSSECKKNLLVNYYLRRKKTENSL